MPPSFLVLFILTVWALVACAVWFAAGVMLLTSRTRSLSRPICLAMAGTFPFVFAYELIAAPFVALLLFVAWSIWRIIEPNAMSSTTQNPVAIISSILAAFLSFGVMLTMGLAGFYEGWRTGWVCANGRPFKQALWEGPTVKLLFAFAKKTKKLSLGHIRRVS